MDSFLCSDPYEHLCVNKKFREQATAGNDRVFRRKLARCGCQPCGVPRGRRVIFDNGQSGAYRPRRYIRLVRSTQQLNHLMQEYLCN